MNFGSFGASFGSFGAGVGGLLPSFTNITSWLKTPTTDGKTLANSRGTDANLTGVNCLSFDGTDDEVNFGTHAIPASDSIEVIFTPQDEADSGILYSMGRPSGGSGYGIKWDGTADRISFRTADVPRNNILNLVTSTNSCVADGTTYKVTYDYDSSAGTATLVLFNADTGATIETESATSVATAAFDVGSSRPIKIGEDQFNLDDYLGKIHYAKSSFGEWAFAEGSGTKVYDVSGNGNHGVITGATWTTENGVESWNHEYGFDTDIFKGYASYWDLASSGSGTWAINESNLTLTGNTGTSPRIRQSVDGMSSGETLVVSGTIEQTGGAGSGGDVGISGSSAGWAESTVLLGGQVGTYTFSTTLNANSSTCDIQFITANGANVVISDLKFTVVKKIPALNTKTKQVVTFDGSADQIDTGFIVPAFTTLTYTTRFKAHILHKGLLVSNRDLANRFLDISIESNGDIKVNFADGSYQAHTFSSAYNVNTLYDLTYTIQSSDSSGTISIQEVGGSLNSSSFDFNTATVLPTNDVRIGRQQQVDTNPFDGEMHSAKLVVDGSTKFEYDFQNNIGTNTIQDLSANNNDGDYTGAQGALEKFWGTRVADTSGSLVSADYATGNTTISNPGGFVHNGSECGVDMVSNDLTSTQLFAINNATADTTFVRKDSGNIVQILDYSSALTGNDLTRTRNYVG